MGEFGSLNLCLSSSHTKALCEVSVVIVAEVNRNMPRCLSGFVDMAVVGKITEAKKNIDKGCQSYAFGAGSPKLYDYLNDNLAGMSAPVNCANDVRVVS